MSTLAQLTATEVTTLDDLERVIESGIRTFVAVGRALEHIRDRRLYREHFSTFEDYCKERWGISRSYAYRQIEGAQVADIASPNGDTPASATESVARELVSLKDDEAALVETWRELQAECGDDMPPTARVVRNAVLKRVNRKRREREAEQVRAQGVPAVTIHHADGSVTTQGKRGGRSRTRKPTKARQEEIGQRHADTTKQALAAITGCQTPTTVLGWAFDGLEHNPEWSWETFIEEIEAAEQSLHRLREKAQERWEEGWV